MKKREKKVKKAEDLSHKEHIGNLIRRLRKAAGLTQMNLADEMGVTYQQVQKYEKGASELTIRRLKQVAGALNVPMSIFIPAEEGVSEPEAPYLTEEEATMLQLFRKVKKKKIRESIVGVVRDIVEATKGE